MLRKFAILLKESKFGFILVKLGIRKSTFIRKLYGSLTKINNDKPVDIGGYTIFIDRNDSLGLLKNPNFYRNNYEVEIMKKFVKRGDVVVDIGANIGIYSLFLGKLVGPTGKVYAFEPDNDNFEILLKNIIINKYRNIIPIKKAISEKTGKIKLYIAEWNKGDHRIYLSDEKRKCAEIDAISLDDFFKKNREKIKFVKIDVQGAESFVFKGGKSFFKNQKPIVLQEFWPVGIKCSGENPENFLNGLNSNFEIFSEKNIKKRICPDEILPLVSVKKRNHINLLCIPRESKSILRKIRKK